MRTSCTAACTKAEEQGLNTVDCRQIKHTTEHVCHNTAVPKAELCTKTVALASSETQLAHFSGYRAEEHLNCIQDDKIEPVHMAS